MIAGAGRVGGGRRPRVEVLSTFPHAAEGRPAGTIRSNKKAQSMTRSSHSTPCAASRRPSIGRRRFARLAAGAAAGALVLGTLGCAGLGGPRTVSVSESELTLLLARQFPLERKVLEVI